MRSAVASRMWRNCCVTIRVGKTGRVRLTGPELEALRREVFERDGYRCARCKRKVTWESGELSHREGRGRGGSDTTANTECCCAGCHRDEHCPKVIPR